MLERHFNLRRIRHAIVIVVAASVLTISLAAALNVSPATAQKTKR